MRCGDTVTVIIISLLVLGHVHSSYSQIDGPVSSASPDVPGNAEVSASIDANTPEPDANTPEPDANTPEPDANTPEPDANTPEPDAYTPEPDANTPEQDANTPEPDANTPEPDANTPEPDANTPEPDAYTPEPDANTPEPDANTPEPDANTTEPDANTPEPDVNTPEPDANTPGPDANTPEPDGSTNGPDENMHNMLPVDTDNEISSNSMNDDASDNGHKSVVIMVMVFLSMSGLLGMIALVWYIRRRRSRSEPFRRLIHDDEFNGTWPTFTNATYSSNDVNLNV